jgi:DNA-binding LytR/AlgR family response regulator
MQFIALVCVPWHNFIMQTLDDRMLVRVQPGRWVVVEINDVFWPEAEGATTMVRLRGRDRICDNRALGEVMDGVERLGFLRIHRQHAVNLRRITEIRRRSGGQDWEVKLDPPVNRVLAVSRGRLTALWEALGRSSESEKSHNP